MKNYQNKVNLFKWTKKKNSKFSKDLVQGTVGSVPKNWKCTVPTACESFQSGNQTWRMEGGLL